MTDFAVFLSRKELRNADKAARDAVRKYLSTGEQPEGVLLVTLACPQRKYVVARISDGQLAWAFHVNPAGRLYSADGFLLIALEREVAKL